MDSPRQRAAELYEAAHQRRIGGNHNGAMTRFQQCLELVAQLGETRWQAEIEREVGLMHHELYDLQPALRWYRQAAGRFNELGDAPEESETVRMAGEVFLLNGSYLEAREEFEQASALAQQSGDPRAEGLALAALGAAGCGAGDAAGGVRLQLEGLQALRACGAAEVAAVVERLRQFAHELGAEEFAVLIRQATDDPELRALLLEA